MNHIKETSSSPKLSLALQGGGSFGAFTWGVLDFLLEKNVSLDVISGASAGTLNAVTLASGLAEGNRENAREKLDRIWGKIQDVGSMTSKTLLDSFSPPRVLSPYQFNWLNINPLRDILDSEIDFERLRAIKPCKLLIATTQIRDGSLRLFRENEITLDVVLASACLPFLHHAVEIDGEAYWDGAYCANPPIYHNARYSTAQNLLLVKIMPEDNNHLPKTVSEISHRLNEIAFTNALRREMEAFELDQNQQKNPIHLHQINAIDQIPTLRYRSMLDINPVFLSTLKEAGRNSAKTFMERHFLEHAM